MEIVFATKNDQNKHFNIHFCRFKNSTFGLKFFE